MIPGLIQVTDDTASYKCKHVFTSQHSQPRTGKCCLCQDIVSSIKLGSDSQDSALLTVKWKFIFGCNESNLCFLNESIKDNNNWPKFSIFWTLYKQIYFYNIVALKNEPKGITSLKYINISTEYLSSDWRGDAHVQQSTIAPNQQEWHLVDTGGSAAVKEAQRIFSHCLHRTCLG